MAATHTPNFQTIGGRSMPERLVKPIWMYLAPSEPPTFLMAALQFLIGALLSWVSGLPPAVQILGIAMFFDYLTGAFAAEAEGKWSWGKGVHGIVKKAIIGIGAVLLHKVTVIAGGGQMIASGLTYCLCFNDGKSSITNLRRMGVEVDAVFDAVLSRLRIQNDSSRLGMATQQIDEGSGKREGGNG